MSFNNSFSSTPRVTNQTLFQKTKDLLKRGSQIITSQDRVSSSQSFAVFNMQTHGEIIEILSVKPKEQETDREEEKRLDVIAKQKLLEGSVGYNFPTPVPEDFLQKKKVILEDVQEKVSLDQSSCDQDQNNSVTIPLKEANLDRDLEHSQKLNQPQFKQVDRRLNTSNVIKKKPSIIPRRRNYSKGKDKESMELALEEWKLEDAKSAKDNSKQSIRHIALKYEIDYKALHERIKGKIAVNSHQGKSSILTQKQEQELGMDMMCWNAYAMSPHGWMTENVFQNYVEFFTKRLPPRHPDEWILMVVDGLGAHVYGLDALQKLYNNKILCVSLPSHTTSVLQPLDVGLFAPLKKYFRHNLSEKQRKNGLKTSLG